MLASQPLPPSSMAFNAIGGSAIRDLLKVTEQPGVLSLAGGLPATEFIPTSAIAAATQLVMTDDAALQYTASRGAATCLRAVAAFIGGSPDEVLITHGSQQALSMLAHAFVDPGDVVIVDDPVYVGARQAFQAARARIVALPITATGTNTAHLAELLESGLRPRIVHTVSNFHNPSGVTADPDTRQALADLAQQYGFWIIDDDPYGCLRFSADDGRRRIAPDPIPGDRAIRLDSASKILAPALRVGWLQGPTGVIDVVERLKQSADLCGSTFSQLVVAQLLSDTQWLDEHIRTLCVEYGARAAELVKSLHRHLGDGVELTVPSGGMFCWARLPGIDSSALLDAALIEGVAFVPGAAFAVDADFSDHLRLSFATLPPDLLGDAIRRLAIALDRTH